METEKVEVNLSIFYRLLHPKLAVLVTSLNTLKDKHHAGGNEFVTLDPETVTPILEKVKE